jgi:hypothetical protein
VLQGVGADGVAVEELLALLRELLPTANPERNGDGAAAKRIDAAPEPAKG